MVAKYEQIPPTNRQWFQGELKELRRLIGEANGRATAAARTTGAAQAVTTGTLNPGTNIALDQTRGNRLTEVFGVVTLNFSLTASAAIAQNAVIATLPASFEPTIQVEFAGAYFGSSWAPAFVYIAGQNVYTGVAMAAGSFMVGSVSFPLD